MGLQMLADTLTHKLMLEHTRTHTFTGGQSSVLWLLYKSLYAPKQLLNLFTPTVRQNELAQTQEKGTPGARTGAAS